ncbi:anaerobic sulfatase maturase [Vibrio chagasii]|uniref:anaerobic sulfatase maturase n=2 Tax=Vibrio chagasii TaxID=170679 RepID=UPI003DA12D9F
MRQNDSCHIMVKPTGSVCNLDCDYCFYLEKEKLYPERNKDYRMSIDTLEKFIKQHIEAQGAPEVIFAWQGGEPTLMGLDFFEIAVKLVSKHNIKNKKITHTFQTNGILINDDWCKFFKINNFLIGLSIDGPEELHDHYRKSRTGRTSFSKVMKAISLLKKYRVEFNTLTVVSDANQDSPLEVYRFLKNLGSKHMQFIPLVERKSRQPNRDGLYLVSPEYDQESTILPHSVAPHKFGNFLNIIFGEWLIEDIGNIYIQMFEHTFAKWVGEASNLCHFSETCGSAFAMESNGDIYACDHYVYSENKLGNINYKSIKNINTSEDNKLFGSNKKNLCDDCQKCKYKFLCNGGCPKHRILPSTINSPNKNYLCQAYKSFFSHSEPYMMALQELVKRGLPPETIKTLL